jgi:hypothetical protein
MINPPLAKKQTPGQVLNVSGLSPFLPFLGLDRPFNPLQSASVCSPYSGRVHPRAEFSLAARQIPPFVCEQKTHKLLGTNSFRTVPRNSGEMLIHSAQLTGTFPSIKIAKLTGKVSQIIKIHQSVRLFEIP